MEGRRTELSGGSGTLKSVAEVLEVFRANFELQNVPDHRMPATDRAEWRRIGGPRRTPLAAARIRAFPTVSSDTPSSYSRAANKRSARRTTPARPRRRTIRFENPLHVFVALFHCLFHCR
jgi:hypothetical protein